MINKQVLRKLKKDYFEYILSWVDRKKLLKSKAKFTVSWDADGDRVFFKDEKNKKVPAYFITALLAEIIQQKYPKAKIAHDSRLVWAIRETVKNTCICKAGWSNFLNFIRKNRILFGGETSGHYYFASSASKLVLNDGLIPVLLIAEKIAKTGKSLAELIRPYQAQYFISPEINFKEKIDLKKLEKNYLGAKISHLDGLSIEYPDYRFNLRPSQTENLWRLNIEARDKNLLQAKKKELRQKIKALF